MIDLDARPKPKPELQLQDFDGELVLYDLEKMKVVYLSESAKLIWQLCDGRRTTGEITRLLQGAYPDMAADIPSDIAAAMEEFVRNETIDW